MKKIACMLIALILLAQCAALSEEISCPGCGKTISTEFVVCPYCSTKLSGEKTDRWYCATCRKYVATDHCPDCGGTYETSGLHKDAWTCECGRACAYNYCGTCGKSKGEVYFGIGESCLKKGDYDGAIAALEQAGTYDGAEEKLAEAQTQKAQKASYDEGVALLEAGDYDGAIAAFERAGSYSDAATKLSEAETEQEQKEYYEKGLTLMAKGDYAGAVSAFTSAGKYADAKDKLAEAEEKQTQQENYEQGLTQLSRGDYESAAAYFTKAGTYADAAEKLAEAQEKQTQKEYYEQGVKLLKKGDYDGAIAAFEKAGTYDGAEEKLAEAQTQKAQKASYDEGVALLEAGDYEGAIAAFERAGSYSDAATKLSEAETEQEQKTYYEKGIRLYERGDYAGAVSAFKSAGRYADAKDKLAEAEEKQEQQENYEEGVALLEKGDYEGAITYLTWAGTYDGAAEKLAEAQEKQTQKEYYEQGVQLYEAGDYEGAIAAFEQAGTYDGAEEKLAEAQEKQTQKEYYEQGVQLMVVAGDYEGAIAAFEKAETYEDAEEQLAWAKEVFLLQYTQAGVGDTVTLGTYAGEQIEWIVLEDRGDGEYVLISKYGLEAKAYNEEWTDVTWETCSLRTWLNGEFYETAFTENEKKLIAQTTIKNYDNPEYGTEGGNDTQDYVYLLSLGEVNRYFANDDARVCYPTAHAVESGAWTNSDTWGGWWWLRSPGSTSYGAADVRYDGYIDDSGIGVNYASVCVRPVVVLRLTENGTIASSEVSETASTEIRNAAGDEAQDQGTLQVGGSVLLGSYEQDGDETNGAEPIEWIVLEDKGDGEYLLISKYCLEAKAYNEEDASVTWETCSLRAWLNGEFYETVFTEDEKKWIAQTTVKNDDNPSYGTEGGNDTQDYVYLLSLDEVNTYFGSNEELVSVATAYAVENGAFTLTQEDVTNYQSSYDYPLTVGAGFWWLRSPGRYGYDAACMCHDGVVGYGIYVIDTFVCARPVVAVRLSNF